MKPSSAKAKGRVLQDWVAEQIRRLPGVHPDDVKCAIMGESGADVKCFGTARKVFPYSVECKNTERLNVWDAYEQAKSHKGGEPLLVMKKNRKKPLVVIDAEHFFELIGANNG